MNVPDVRTFLTVCVVCVLTLWAPLRASAQTNSEINTGVEFDMSLPGARSLGLGGAFVAVADDATAAVSNPAGLTALGRPEVSVEGRGWRFLSVTPYEGHAFGPATRVGVDTIEGLTIGGNTSKSTGGLSFVSAVFPKGPLVVGVFADRKHADEAVSELRKAGFREDQIGVAMRYEGGEVHSTAAPTTMDTEEDTHAGTGALTGAA